MSKFNGFSDHLPGTYSMTRRIEGQTKAAWKAIDFRGPGWMGGCQTITFPERQAAAIRGELKRVTFTIDAGTLKIARSETPDPADAYTQIDSGGNFTVAEFNFGNWEAVYQLFIQAAGADYEVEIWFDIPAAGDV